MKRTSYHEFLRLHLRNLTVDKRQSRYFTDEVTQNNLQNNNSFTGKSVPIF